MIFTFFYYAFNSVWSFFSYFILVECVCVCSCNCRDFNLATVVVVVTLLPSVFETRFRCVWEGPVLSRAVQFPVSLSVLCCYTHQAFWSSQEPLISLKKAKKSSQKSSAWGNRRRENKPWAEERQTMCGTSSRTRSSRSRSGTPNWRQKGSVPRARFGKSPYASRLSTMLCER